MITIGGAYEWLNKFDEKESYLTSPSDVLWDQIQGYLKIGGKKKAKRKAHKKAEKLISDLLNICERSNLENECAEACLNCGMAYFGLRKRKKSIKLLREAISRYQTHRHNQTVARWALGYVLLVMTSQNEDAIVQWKNCVETYRDLLENHRFEKDKVEWYHARINEMDKSLEEAATFTP